MAWLVDDQPRLSPFTQPRAWTVYMYSYVLTAEDGGPSARRPPREAVPCAPVRLGFVEELRTSCPSFRYYAKCNTREQQLSCADERCVANDTSSRYLGADVFVEHIFAPLPSSRHTCRPPHMRTVPLHPKRCTETAEAGRSRSR